MGGREHSGLLPEPRGSRQQAVPWELPGRSPATGLPLPTPPTHPWSQGAVSSGPLYCFDLAADFSHPPATFSTCSTSELRSSSTLLGSYFL